MVGASPWWVARRRAGRVPAAGWRAGRRRRGLRGRALGARRAVPPPAVDAAFLLDLCAAALAAGAALPRTLGVVGRHLGGADGDALVRAGSTLELGGAWASAWTDAPAGAAAVGAALATGWEAGASPGPQLRAAADRLRRDRRAAVRTAAGSLAVRLTLPLGLCFLPAFALLGLVPVVLGLAAGIGW
ncbi:secretion system protein [Cellulomonas shaoxiangyii]|uniref:Secretion system protein n=2 Tax=Cellulomonas shaoxiangyii TaxID=2566013 RepID=A0A4P7SNP6_9CELL|nr:secretion system protein [Cellulomonas shaoxiangyii]